MAITANTIIIISVLYKTKQDILYTMRFFLKKIIVVNCTYGADSTFVRLADESVDGRAGLLSNAASGNISR